MTKTIYISWLLLMLTGCAPNIESLIHNPRSVVAVDSDRATFTVESWKLSIAGPGEVPEAALTLALEEYALISRTQPQFDRIVKAVLFALKVNGYAALYYYDETNQPRTLGLYYHPEYKHLELRRFSQSGKTVNDAEVHVSIDLSQP